MASRAGIPNKSSVTGRDLALRWGPDAVYGLATLAGLVRNPDGTPAPGASQSDGVRLGAMVELTNRAYGKPHQIVAGDEAGGPIRHTMVIAVVGPDGKLIPFDPAKKFNVDIADGADDFDGDVIEGTIDA
jgi:hypothetical protein